MMLSVSVILRKSTVESHRATLIFDKAVSKSGVVSINFRTWPQWGWWLFNLKALIVKS